jgi:hypothetical protein
MGTSLWSGTPLPDTGSQDDIPAILAAIFDSIDSKFNLTSLDESDRDSKFLDLPAGSLVVTLDTFSLWMKMEDHSAVWTDVLYDTDWVTSGFANSTGWNISFAKVRRVGKVVELRGASQRTGADIVASGSGSHAGNITDSPILIAPAGFLPTTEETSRGVTMQFEGSSGMGSGYLGPSGAMVMTSYSTGATISTGDVYWFTKSFFLG